MTPSSSPSLIIHTLNSPKSLKPTSHGHAADAIHQTLHFALDGHTDDWHLSPSEYEHQQHQGCGGPSSPLSSQQHKNVKAGFLPQPLSSHTQNRPYISYYLADSGLSSGPDSNAGGATLHIPHPFTIPDPIRTDPCAVEDRDRFDVTVKFFFQGQDQHHHHDIAALEDALATFRRNTGLLTVDTLLLCWPSIVQRWADKHRTPDKELAQRDLDRVRAVWQSTSASPYAGSLGLCDLPVSFLEALFPPSPQTPSPPTIPSEFRLPRVISLSSQRNPPCASHEELLSWCKTWAWQTDPQADQEHVQILSHSDPHDMLPDQSLPSILREFQGRIPLPAPGPNGATEPASKEWAESLRTQWLLKYTVLISDRGLLADAGYLVRAG